ncbi:hypothetical protein LIER_27424 [Lithospermum erythrorhizon]|uniref:C2H2-type domain-containing protein n=1 Tax=Lithospermum erythrorhizon TaxID=34254 RepID=A0AAV3RHZ2_LITER
MESSNNLVLNPLNQTISHDTHSNASLDGAIPQMQRETNEQQMEGTLVRDPNPPHTHPNNISSPNLQLVIDLETESSNEYANNTVNNQVIPMDTPSDGSSNEMQLALPRFVSRGGPFICKGCNREFATSQALGAHQNMHRQERARRRRVRNNFVATPPSNIPPFNYPSHIPPFNYPSNIPPLNSPYAYYYSNLSRPGNMVYNPPFDGPIGFRTGPIIQRPSAAIGGSSSSYNFHNDNNMWANSYLMTPTMSPYNQMMNAAIYQYQNAWWGSDISLGGIFASTTSTNNGAGSSTHNNIIEGSYGERLVQRVEDDQGRDEPDLTLKL